MEKKYIPHIMLPTVSINAIYMQHCISRKRLEALYSVYETVNREVQYNKWIRQHPILSRIPFVKRYIRKNMGL